jgi:hypothetical protein
VTQLYTCETTTAYSTSAPSCTSTYTPDVQSYDYSCTSTYNYRTGAWDESPGCAPGKSDPNCKAGPATCTRPTAPNVQTYSCQQGYTSATSTGVSDGACQNTDNVTVTTSPGSTVWSYAGSCVEGGGLDCGSAYPGCQLNYRDQEGGYDVYDAYCPTTTPGRTTITDAWSNGCAGLATNCTVTGTSCSQGAETRTINGVAVYRDCWQSTSTYSCTTKSTVNTPVNTCPSGAALQRGSCAGTDSTGACTVWNYTYQVTTADPAGPCAQYATTFACAGDRGGTWSADCPQASDPSCTSTGSVCTDGPGSKTVGGVGVYEACWARRTDYSCTVSTKSDDCHPQPQCKKTLDHCLDDPPPADASQCLTMDHEYACTTNTTTTSSFDQCGPKLCLQDACYTLDHPQNSEFAQTFSQLSALDQASKDYQANTDLTVFKGQPLKCRKAVVGFLDCCKDSGWGPALGLAQCTADEKKLIDQQTAKATHYAGTYCSKKIFPGICVEKSMAYCSFAGALARIIQEAGHQQLPKGWGSAASPDCSGFTIDQFQKLDLTHVDFSDFYKQKLAAFQTPDAGSTAGNIQASINALYATGKPSAGGPQ